MSVQNHPCLNNDEGTTSLDSSLSSSSYRSERGVKRRKKIVLTVSSAADQDRRILMKPSLVVLVILGCILSMHHLPLLQAFTPSYIHHHHHRRFHRHHHHRYSHNNPLKRNRITSLDDSTNTESGQNNDYSEESLTAPEVDAWTDIMTNPNPFSNSSKPPTTRRRTPDDVGNNNDSSSYAYETQPQMQTQPQTQQNQQIGDSQTDSYLSSLNTCSSTNDTVVAPSSSSSSLSSQTTTSTARSTATTAQSSNHNSISNNKKNDIHYQQQMQQQQFTLNLHPDTLSQEDHLQIETYWDQLMPHVSFLGTTNAFQIKNALRVAYISHRHQRRKSGEPFVIHPIEVAILLTELHMDAETIMAGLLHDTVEDTELTFEQIELMFGSTVKSIVEGETKVSKLPRLEFQDYADEQAENLRQMFVAMTDDYRIIIVKLADRLHNMRTLEHMKPEKQKKISRETMDIFAPLAHRMGIWQFKSELEDISFKYLEPEAYGNLKGMLKKHGTKLNKTLIESKRSLETALKNDSILKKEPVKFKVYSRTKELYSLYHKMVQKNETDFDHINDIIALRVIIEPMKERKKKFSNSSRSSGSSSSSEGINDNNVDSVEQNDDESDKKDPDWGVWLCYHILGIVQRLDGFHPVPNMVKDYISFAKPNGYQSIHTALNLNGQIIEVQIRTAAMHKIAEYGMASHWVYKDGKKREEIATEKFNDLFITPWMSNIKHWNEEDICSRTFVDSVRRDLLGKRVFVFLRNGKILNLTKGSTVIDAAFQIHTDLGLSMRGVEINGKPVPFTYELQNGDVVNVLPDGTGKPDKDWIQFATARSTRSKLRSYFRREQSQSYRDAGEILLMNFLNMHAKVIEDSSYLEEPFEVPSTVEGMNKFLPGKSNYEDVDNLLIHIGNKDEDNFLRSVMAKIFLVPQKTLAKADENPSRLISKQTLDEVNAKRKSALDAGTVLWDDNDDDENMEMSMDSSDDQDDDKLETFVNGPHFYKSSPTTINSSHTAVRGSVEIADPEHVCPACLPIFGDEIIGTRPHGTDSNDFVTTVHRSSCDIVLRARNDVKNTQIEYKEEKSEPKGSGQNGIRMKRTIKSPVKSYDVNKNFVTKMKEAAKCNNSKYGSPELDLVGLVWDESYAIGEKILYISGVSLICEDRSLLLSDCSKVVSEMAEIVKTESITTNEHANLNFQVKVKNLDHLQELMDKLNEIESVMSVERRFGIKMEN